MPTYDYECTQCERKFELFESITSKPKKKIATECDQCNNKAPVIRLIGTGGGVIFKGSGFYTTDYRSESYNKAAKADKESGSGTSTAATKDSASSDGSSSDGKPDSGKTADTKTVDTKSSGSDNTSESQSGKSTNSKSDSDKNGGSSSTKKSGKPKRKK